MIDPEKHNILKFSNTTDQSEIIITLLQFIYECSASQYLIQSIMKNITASNSEKSLIIMHTFAHKMHTLMLLIFYKSTLWTNERDDGHATSLWGFTSTTSFAGCLPQGYFIIIPRVSMVHSFVLVFTVSTTCRLVNTVRLVHTTRAFRAYDFYLVVLHSTGNYKRYLRVHEDKRTRH